jgi:hypothetical protein
MDGTKPTSTMAQQAAVQRSFDIGAQLFLFETQRKRQSYPGSRRGRQQTAMAEGIRAELPHTLNTQAGLRDFCAIRGIAKSFATTYELRVSEGAQGLSFRAVGSAFRSWFTTRYPSSRAPSRIIRGSAI